MVWLGDQKERWDRFKRSVESVPESIALHFTIWDHAATYVLKKGPIHETFCEWVSEERHGMSDTPVEYANIALKMTVRASSPGDWGWGRYDLYCVDMKTGSELATASGGIISTQIPEKDLQRTASIMENKLEKDLNRLNALVTILRGVRRDP